MSLVTDVRGYAETALEQGKTIAGQAQSRLGAASEDAQGQLKSYAGTARKQAYALLGAGDVAISTISKRAETLPGEARGKAQSYAAAGQSAVAELRGRGEQAVKQAVGEARDFTPADGVKTARSTVEAYFGQAKATYDALADRGQKVALYLRGTVEGVVNRTEADALRAAKPTAAKILATKPPTQRKPAAKKAAAKRTPATKRTARAGGSAVKSTARKSTARKAPAKSAR